MEKSEETKTVSTHAEQTKLWIDFLTLRKALTYKNGIEIKS